MHRPYSVNCFINFHRQECLCHICLPSYRTGTFQTHNVANGGGPNYFRTVFNCLCVGDACIAPIALIVFLTFTGRNACVTFVCLLIEPERFKHTMSQMAVVRIIFGPYSIVYVWATHASPP